MVIGQIDTQTAGNKYKYVTKSKLSINLFYVFLVLYLPWVIPAGCVTDIVFREPILILPPVETNTCIFHHNSKFDWLHHIWYDFQHNCDASSKVNVLPLLSGFTAELRDGEVFLPMVGPVQLARRRLASPKNR